MINYYSQDSNYSDLTGVIRSIKPLKGTDELFLEIDLLSENPDFSCNLETGYYEFVLVNRSAKDYDLPSYSDKKESVLRLTFCLLVLRSTAFSSSS